ncbi:MAG: hypothetical protein ACI9ES_000551 [Oceanospirillaceae bacterium]|jgi:hypothetical protein
MLSEVCNKMACPACGQYGAIPFFYGEKQPLATLGWPENFEQAQSMPVLPLDFVSCIDCSHIFNESFCYDHVPYSDNPNRMYNQSNEWQNYISSAIAALVKILPTHPIIIEIGCGEGHFLRQLSTEFETGRFIGFDPNGAVEKGDVLEFHKEFFEPTKHMAQFKPDLIICRHVIEHLTQPLALFQPIMQLANSSDKAVKLFIEVPCIDNLYENQRISDFFYEHISNFNSLSFTNFINRLGGKLIYSGKGYGNEVIFACIGSMEVKNKHVTTAIDFNDGVKEAKKDIRDHLFDLLKQNKKIAIWGGSGKSASFINYYQLDASNFPVVVDSDIEKASYFVPGMGQKIEFRDYLLTHPVDVIIIPPQWRARDIAHEIHAIGIRYECLLIEDKGKLINLESDINIYYEVK